LPALRHHQRGARPPRGADQAQGRGTHPAPGFPAPADGSSASGAGGAWEAPARRPRSGAPEAGSSSGRRGQDAHGRFCGWGCAKPGDSPSGPGPPRPPRPPDLRGRRRV